MNKKIISLVLVCVIVFGLVVGGTLAWLQDKTDVVTNTFTVGNVDIDLTEAPATAYGVADNEATRVTQNTYKLIPGHKYDKDPTVFVKKGSEICYVFVKVVNGLENIEAAGNTTIAKQMETNKWKQLVVDEAPVNNVYYYETTVDALEEASDIELVVFESFTLADGAAVADYTSATIEITGYAVQADGFNSAAAAWQGANFS